jgi:hypothetical protein
MNGDFTRLAFDALRRFVRVVLQQGPVAVDADANDVKQEADARPSSPGRNFNRSERKAVEREPD